MTIAIANVVSNNSFEYWYSIQSNKMADALSVKVVTVDSNAAVGNAAIAGWYKANGVQSNTVIVDNGAGVTSILTPNTISVGNSTVNVSINATSLSIANSTTSLVLSSNATFVKNAYNMSITGECILQYVNATAISLKPYNGNRLVVSSLERNIPNTGITLTNAGLSANTLYYVYATANDTSTSLTTSTTSYTLANNGTYVKSSNVEHALVGMAYTNSSNNFVDNTSHRFVASWFHNKHKALNATYHNTILTTNTVSSNVMVDVSALGSNSTLEFVAWANAVVEINYALVAHSAKIAFKESSLLLDGANTVVSRNYSDIVPSGFMSFAEHYNFEVSEGKHKISVGLNSTSTNATSIITIYDINLSGKIL